MNHLQEVKHDLEFYPQIRERSNKNLYIARKLHKLYRLHNTMIDEVNLMDLIVEAASMDRAWRAITMKYPHLRGKDYQEKYSLAKRKQKELGYETNQYKG